MRTSLVEAAAHGRTDFAVVAAASWAAALRKSDAPTAAYDLVVELLKICSNDERRIQVIQQLYGGSPPLHDIGELTQAEHDYLRSLAPLFVKNRQGPVFIQTVAWTFYHDWPALKALVERVLDDIPHEQVSLAVKSLIDAVYWALERNPVTLPQGLGPWLLDQLLRMPALDSLGGDLGWRVEEILKRSDRAPFSWLLKALAKRRDMEAQCGYEKVRAVSRHARISRHVAPISATHMNDPEVKKAVEALVDFVWDRGTVGYHLPEVLRDVDPEGLLIPVEVTRRLANVTSKEDAWLLARIAGVYTVGGSAWRTIAKPVIVRAVRSGSEEGRRSLFDFLTYNGPRAWSGTPGEVPQIFISGVQSARQMLESETDPEFQPFWKWYLAVAEAKLREQGEYAKEERGE